MMKLSRLFALLILVLLVGEVAGQCRHKSNRELRNLLGLYFYDSSRYSDFESIEYKQFQEFEVKLFSSSQYKMVFDVSQSDEDVLIQVYERDGSNRKLVWNNKDNKPNEYGNFEYMVNNESKKLIIHYELPARANSGCVAMVLGFVVKQDVVKKPRKPRVRIE